MYVKSFNKDKAKLKIEIRQHFTQRVKIRGATYIIDIEEEGVWDVLRWFLV